MNSRFSMFKKNAGQSEARSVQPAPQQNARSFSLNNNSHQPRSLGHNFTQRSRGFATPPKKRGGCRSCGGAV